MSFFALDQPMWLPLLLLALPPWFRYWTAITRHPYLALLKTGAGSHGFDSAVRLLATLVVCALTLGLAGLHKPLSFEPRVGSGAHVVIALDRSRSMDQPFADGSRSMRIAERMKAASKGEVAREVLQDFVRSRSDDMFAFVAFSTQAIPVASLTHKQDMLFAAIGAGDIGRGLGDTNIGQGLLQSLAQFEGKEFTGSRIILLVSDGAAHLDADTRRRINELTQQHRVALYWVYIRTANGPDIFDEKSFNSEEGRLHTFFGRLKTPYRGYSAERPTDLAQAVADIAQLQNLPLNYDEQIPRVELATVCFALAFILLCTLLVIDWACLYKITATGSQTREA